MQGANEVAIGRAFCKVEDHRTPCSRLNEFSLIILQLKKFESVIL